MTSELKPCPFCGGDAEYYTDNGPTGEVYGWVGCNQCDAMSCHIDVRSMQPEEAHPIDAWNTRAEQAAELAKFKALAETLAGALEQYDQGCAAIGGCSDGYCVIQRPKGMHTNGGCRCSDDRNRMRRFASRAAYFREKVAEALRQYKEARDD